MARASARPENGIAAGGVSRIVRGRLVEPAGADRLGHDVIEGRREEMESKTVTPQPRIPEARSPSSDARWPLAGVEREKDGLFVGSIEKAACILYAFGQGRGTLRLNEIARITGLGRSAAQRYTHTLCSLGFLQKVDEGPVYRPAPRMLDFSFIYLRSDSLVEVATPHLIEATRVHDETINLSRRQDDSMIFIVRIPGRGGAESHSIPGGRMPVFCTTAGRSILAHLPGEEARRLIESSERRPLTPKTITGAGEIMALVRQAATDGFSVADEEGQLGLITVGAAILDRTGYPVAAVNMAAPCRTWSIARVRKELGPLIIETARKISRTQGFSASYHES